MNGRQVLGGASAATLGLLCKLVLQSLYFLFLARALGAHEYGALATVAAVTGMMSPLVGVGADSVLIRHLNREGSDFARVFGVCLKLTVVSGIVLCGTAVGLLALALPYQVAAVTLASLCAADLVISRTTDLYASALQAHERMTAFAAVHVISSGTRAIAAGAFAFGGYSALSEWAGIMLSTAVLSLGAASLIAHGYFRMPFALGGPVRVTRLGALFCATVTLQNVMNDSSKIALSRWEPLSVVGVYGVATKLLEVAYAPVKGFLQATYPDCFREGVRGPGRLLGISVGLIKPAIVYGGLAALGLVAVAQALPGVLGNGYAMAAEVLPWLALVPVARAWYAIPNQALTGADFNGARTALQFFAAARQVVLFVTLIPVMGWRGAAIADLLAAVALGVASWTVLRLCARQSAAYVPASASI